MPLRYLFIDMNSYFASVEQQERPELRGRPVAVVPMLAETTCCIAASYEAKRFGVKTGTRVREARQLCPGIQLIPARHELYVEYHHRILKAVGGVLAIAGVLSVDEVACKLHGVEQKQDEAERLARQIKAALRRELGEQMRCSVGIAPNTLLAKIAADMHKPDGLTVIRSEDLPQRLHGLELKDFPGVGRKMEQRLHRFGVRTAKEF